MFFKELVLKLHVQTVATLVPFLVHAISLKNLLSLVTPAPYFRPYRNVPVVRVAEIV